MQDFLPSWRMPLCSTGCSYPFMVFMTHKFIQTCRLQILACANILLGHIEPADDIPSPCASSNSSLSNYNSVCHSSPFSTASVDGGTSRQDAVQSAPQLQSAQEVAEAPPLPAYFFPLETATSLSSVNTAV